MQSRALQFITYFIRLLHEHAQLVRSQTRAYEDLLWQCFIASVESGAFADALAAAVPGTTLHSDLRKLWISLLSRSGHDRSQSFG